MVLMNHNGVADYFATLGIAGETLELKSKKKLYALQHDSDADTNGNAYTNTNASDAIRVSTQEQEEEYLMMQRFYRDC